MPYSPRSVCSILSLHRTSACQCRSGGREWMLKQVGGSGPVMVVRGAREWKLPKLFRILGGIDEGFSWQGYTQTPGPVLPSRRIRTPFAFSPRDSRDAGRRGGVSPSVYKTWNTKKSSGSSSPRGEKAPGDGEREGSRINHTRSLGSSRVPRSLRAPRRCLPPLLGPLYLRHEKITHADARPRSVALCLPRKNRKTRATRREFTRKKKQMVKKVMAGEEAEL